MSHLFLGLYDLKDITDYLLDLENDHIYDLGIVFGLDQKKVKEKKTSSHFLDDVISSWLRRECNVERCGTPSWRILAEALMHKRLRQTGLANQIAKEKSFSLNKNTQEYLTPAAITNGKYYK